MASSPTAEIAGLTSPSTSPGPTGASPDSVSAALGTDHAGRAEVVQSPIQAQGGLAVGEDSIGADSDVASHASADATTDPGQQSAPEGPDSDGQSSEGSVVTFPNKAGGRVGGTSRSSRARSGRRGRVSDNDGIVKMLAEHVGKLTTHIIQSQRNDRAEATRPVSGGVGLRGVDVVTSAMLASAAVQALRLCETDYTSSERQNLDLQVKGWMAKTQTITLKSVESFETDVAGLLSRYGSVPGGAMFATMVRLCLGVPEPVAGGGTLGGAQKRRELCGALESFDVSIEQRQEVHRAVVAADQPHRLRQIKVQMLVGVDKKMSALDSAALRHLTTVLDVAALETIAGCSTFIAALCELHRLAGACRSQAEQKAVERLVNLQPIQVSSSGMTLSGLVDAVNKNVDERLVRVNESGMTLFNIAVAQAVRVVPTGGGDATGSMCVDVKRAMLKNSGDPAASPASLQADLKAVSENWESLSQAKLPFKEARPVSGVSVAPAMLAGGANPSSSKWQSPAAKESQLRRGAPTADKGGAATAVVPPVQRGWNRQGAGGDGR